MICLPLLLLLAAAGGVHPQYYDYGPYNLHDPYSGYDSDDTDQNQVKCPSLVETKEWATVCFWSIEIRILNQANIPNYAHPPPRITVS